MQVPDRLASVSAHVDHQAPAPLGQALPLRQLAGTQEQPPCDLEMTCLEAVQRLDVLPRSDQDVHRSLGRDIAEREQVLALQEEIRFELAAGDAAEEAVGAFKGRRSEVDEWRWPSDHAGDPKRAQPTRWSMFAPNKHQ